VFPNPRNFFRAALSPETGGPCADFETCEVGVLHGRDKRKRSAIAEGMDVPMERAPPNERREAEPTTWTRNGYVEVYGALGIAGRSLHLGGYITVFRYERFR